MKATIRDGGALARLEPAQVVSYLLAHGWEQERMFGSLGSVWQKKTPEGRRVEALVPLDPEVADFVTRMSDVLRALEAVEGRSQLDIYRDLSTATDDTVRFSFHGAGFEDGTTPIEIGARLFDATRDLIRAAANAAVEPRPAFLGRMPSQADAFIQQARFGPTERGSFVLTVQTPVSPEVAPQLSLFDEPEAPFPRRVMLTLAHGVDAARRAAGEATAKGDVQVFLGMIEAGVSANLCQALAEMLGDGAVDELGVAIAWAPGRPERSGAPTSAVFTPGDAAVLTKAARLFRERAAREDFEIEGAVVKLDRPVGMDSGEVTIAAPIDGVVRRVKLDLGRPEYDQAIQAHQNELTVRVHGALDREGRSFVLRHPRDFRVVESVSLPLFTGT